MPRPAANRYEYAAVGELVHLDIKKWAVSGRSENASTKTACDAAATLAGNTPTSP